MLHIYRLEDPHHVGPYHSKLGEWVPAEVVANVERVMTVMGERHMRSSYHRNRLSEVRTQSELGQFLDKHSADWQNVKHACHSECALRRWFGVFYPLLEQAGFVLAVYEVKREHCFVFPEQIVYLHDKATRLN